MIKIIYMYIICMYRIEMKTVEKIPIWLKKYKSKQKIYIVYIRIWNFAYIAGYLDICRFKISLYFTIVMANKLYSHSYNILLSTYLTYIYQKNASQSRQQELHIFFCNYGAAIFPMTWNKIIHLETTGEM